MEICKSPEMKRLSIFQWIIFQLGGTAIQYPIKCPMCGKEIRGNMISGYRFGCEHGSIWNKTIMKFTPSPTKKVRFVDKDGSTVKVVSMNRAKRRKLKIGR